MKDGMATFRWADGDIDAARYTMNSRVGDGARWSADRKKAWRLVAGEPVEEISLERAAKMSDENGGGSLTALPVISCMLLVKKEKHIELQAQTYRASLPLSLSLSLTFG